MVYRYQCFYYHLRCRPIKSVIWFMNIMLCAVYDGHLCKWSKLYNGYCWLMPVWMHVVIKCFSLPKHPHEFIQIASWWCYNIHLMIYFSSCLIFMCMDFYTNIIGMYVAHLLGLWLIHNRMGYTTLKIKS